MYDQLRVGELEQFLDKRSQTRRQLAPSFIFVIHEYPTLSTNGISQLLTLVSGYSTGNYAEPITPTRAKCFRSSSPIMLTIRPSYFSARRTDRRLKLIVSLSTFGLTIHTGSQRKNEKVDGGIHFPRRTRIISC
jgi:hypothetical protein